MKCAGYSFACDQVCGDLIFNPNYTTWATRMSGLLFFIIKMAGFSIYQTTIIR